MPHPGCENQKAAHFLNETVLEWAIFESVQPLFASPLPWALIVGQPPEGHHPLGDQALAQAIDIENAFDSSSMR